MGISRVVVLIMLVMMVLAGLRRVRENERLAVFRLGRFAGVCGPGVLFVIPVMDRTVRVLLDDRIPEWRGLAEDELKRRVREAVLAETAPQPR